MTQSDLIGRPALILHVASYRTGVVAWIGSGRL